MFEHSIKVPRHYKIAANIFKKVSIEGGSVKSLLYDIKLRHFRTNVLFALISETIKHSTAIDKIFENCNLFNNEPRLDPWLAKILTTELLFGKKSLPGKSKPEQTIVSYKNKFETLITNHKEDSNTEGVQRPRYVRINTNLFTTSDAIGFFQEEGYHFIRCTSKSYDDYLKQIKNLGKYEFTQDFHLKSLFVFDPSTKFHEHELYLEHKIILQDKATAMAAQLLSPPQGSIVMDMCAAPGMKTTQLAALMRNDGKIYAIERNEKRYQTLCEFVKNTDSKCVQTLHKDALDIRKGEFDDVEYILLDPSCSGSGMELCVHNYIEETRLAKLTSLQEKFLKHAMNSFPKARRIVYSTCSIFPEENERVVANVVKTSRSKWRVLDVKELLKDQWNNFGSNMYGSVGSRCMYARPKEDLTTGFFLAVLERDPIKIKKEKHVTSSDIDNVSVKKPKDKSLHEICEQDIQGDNCKSKVKKKNKKKDVVLDSVTVKNLETTYENSLKKVKGENQEMKNNCLKRKINIIEKDDCVSEKQVKTDNECDSSNATSEISNKSKHKKKKKK